MTDVLAVLGAAAAAVGVLAGWMAGCWCLVRWMSGGHGTDRKPPTHPGR